MEGPGAGREEATVRVVLADDHASVRAGLRLILETSQDIVVVGEAADGPTAVAQAQVLHPDVVLMDARMPGGDGVEATRRITGQNAGHNVGRGAVQVLMLTTFDLDEVVFGALRAGAAGFLLKSVEPDQLLDGIRAVARGDGVVAPEVTRRVLDALVTGPGRPTETPPGLAELTDREHEVLAALGQGCSNAQIAGRLGVSLPTVKTHVSNVLMKLQVATRMQAAVIAREHGPA